MAYNLSFPTVNLIDNFFNSNKVNPSSTFSVSKTLSVKTTPNIMADGFHFEPNYFSAPTLNGNELWGIDIPVLLQKDKNKKADNLLIIIGQDPLRKNTDTYLNFLFNNSIPPKQISIQNHTIIGTPYAVAAYNACQSKGTNNQYPKSQIYYDLFDAILTNKDYDYDIYLTDVRKYYPNIKVSLAFSNEKLIQQELDILQKTYKSITILLSGEEAHKAWAKIASNINNCIITHHLSYKANGYWTDFFKSNIFNPVVSKLLKSSTSLNGKKIIYILSRL